MLSKFNDLGGNYSCKCHITSFLILILFINMQLGVSGEELKSRVRKSTFTLLAPGFTGFVILGKSLNLTPPWFPNL